MGLSTRSVRDAARPRVDRRNERKFLLSRDQAELLLAAAQRRLEPDRHTGLAAKRTQTTYFDTDDRELFRRLQGALRVRLRQYEDGASFLEAKYVDGVARTKLRLPMYGAFADVWAGVVNALPDDVPLPDQVRAGHLAPCLTTEYQRQSFRDPDTGLRVTVDMGVWAGLPCGARKVDFGTQRVAEVKYRAELPAWLAEMLTRFEEAHGFSKFRWGCTATATERVSRGASREV